MAVPTELKVLKPTVGTWEGGGGASPTEPSGVSSTFSRSHKPERRSRRQSFNSRHESLSRSLSHCSHPPFSHRLRATRPRAPPPAPAKHSSSNTYIPGKVKLRSAGGNRVNKVASRCAQGTPVGRPLKWQQKTNGCEKTSSTERPPEIILPETTTKITQKNRTVAE